MAFHILLSQLTGGVKPFWHTHEDGWRWPPLCLNLIAGAPQAAADVMIIESRSGGQNTTWYADSSFLSSSVKSSAPGCTAGIGCRYGHVVACTVTLTPTVAVAGGLYELDVTHTTSVSTSADIMVNIAVTGGVFTNTATHVTASAIWTTAFQLPGGNTWKVVGVNEDIQLDPGVTQFTLNFSTTNTDLDAGANRRDIEP